MSVVTVSYLSATVAYLVLALLLLASRTFNRPTMLLLAASVITSLWAASVAFSVEAGSGVWLVKLLDVTRTVVWLLFLWTLVANTIEWLRDEADRRYALLLLFGAAVVSATLAEYLLDRSSSSGVNADGTAIGLSLRLVLAVIGLVLVENLFRKTTADTRWSVKFAVLGTGTIFVYDFFMYAHSLLFNQISIDYFTVRGAVNALAMPLLAIAAVRNRQWAINIHISRDAVFHTATVVGSGAYLLTMAAVGYYLRHVGGEWGSFLGSAFFIAAILFMLMALFSEAVRSNIRLFISKNFFSYRYDYRYEWLRFIRTIGGTDGTLHDRVIRAVADIVDSTSGAIWLHSVEDDCYRVAATWNFPDDLAVIAGDTEVVIFLAERRWIIDMNELADQPDLYGGLSMPEGIETLSKAWLIVPFVHRDEMQGFIVLGRPRAKQTLNWEVFDLLKTVGQQGASYLAEERAMRALVDAQQLEDFNRRFAFVIHDIKNIASQWSLVLSNADRHGDKPEFQRDVMDTLRHSVEKMSHLLGRVQSDRETTTAVELALIDIVPVVRRALAHWLGRRPLVEIETKRDNLQAFASGETLATTVGHIVQNAVEAVGEDGRILVRLAEDGNQILIEVADDGPGMSPEFIREQLYRPLRTTKGTGYGIGAYQTRELVREMGGRMDVESAVGDGTTVRVWLRGATAHDRTVAQHAERGM